MGRFNQTPRTIRPFVFIGTSFDMDITRRNKRKLTKREEGNNRFERLRKYIEKAKASELLLMRKGQLSLI